MFQMKGLMWWNVQKFKWNSQLSNEKLDVLKCSNVKSRVCMYNVPMLIKMVNEQCWNEWLDMLKCSNLPINVLKYNVQMKG